MGPFRKFTALLPAVFLAASPVAAEAGMFPTVGLSSPSLVVETGANCYAVGQRLAAEKGGTLMQASARKSGGQTVCHIVIKVPGSKGKRPRRAEFTVPAN